MKAGDRVVCIKKGQWQNTITSEPVCGPKYGDILIIDGVNDRGYLLFEQYRYQLGRNDFGLLPERFAILQDNFAEQILAKASEEHKKMKPKVIELI